MLLEAGSAVRYDGIDDTAFLGTRSSTETGNAPVNKGGTALLTPFADMCPQRAILVFANILC